MAINKQYWPAGGSFDPSHNAHIALADGLSCALRWTATADPCRNPWQRAPLAASPAAPRRHAATTSASALLHINTIRNRRGRATYTIDTLQALPAMTTSGYWVPIS